MMDSYKGPDALGLEFFGTNVVKDLEGFAIAIIIPADSEKALVSHIEYICVYCLVLLNRLCRAFTKQLPNGMMWLHMNQ